MYPVIFRLGPLFISPSSILSLLALFTIMFVFWYQCRKDHVNEDYVFDLMALLIVFGLVFGRLQFVIFHYWQFSPNLLRVFLFLKYPGFGIGLALIVGFVATCLFSFKKKLPTLLILDHLSLSFTLGFTLVSLGFFLSGVGGGSESHLPWTSTFPGIIGKRHPLSLYEMVIFFFLFILILWLKKSFPHHQIGVPTLLFVWFFGLSLFAIEFLRVNDVYSIFGIRVGNLLGLILILGGTIMLSKKGFSTLLFGFKKRALTSLFAGFCKKRALTSLFTGRVFHSSSQKMKNLFARFK